MSATIPRRFAVAGIALIVAFVLLRTEIALALVFRGDDAMSRSQISAALKYYRRALFLDPASAVASDRLAFAAFLGDSPQEMQGALTRMDAALVRDPRDVVLRKDRALLEIRLGDRVAAEADLVAAGRSGRDARSMAFAGFLRADRGDCVQARRWLREALRMEPRLAIARRRANRAC